MTGQGVVSNRVQRLNVPVPFIICQNKIFNNNKIRGFLQMDKHGMSRTKFNVIWRNMKHRCMKNDYSYYKKYGIKRINLHEEWNEFINFKNDVYEEYLKCQKEHPGKIIMFVRKDLSKGFTPANCEFRVKGLHRSVECIGYAPDGTTHVFINQKEFAEKHNLSRYNISKCLKGERLYHKGWLFQYRGELNDKSS